MDRPPLEVADLVRAAGDAFIERSRKWITWKHVKALLAMARCRTAMLGGHLDECTRFPFTRTVLVFFIAGLLFYCASSASIIGSVSHPAGDRPSHLI
jgi:hypothetical protein